MISKSPIFKSTQDIKVELDKIPHLGYEFLSKDKNLYTHSLLMIGILNRTYELTDSAIWAIDNNRPQTSANMLRALIETLGLAHHAWKNVRKENNPGLFEKIASLLLGSRNSKTSYQSVNVLTCIDGATEIFSQLRKNYDDISEMVHPNGTSFMYSGKATGKQNSGEIMIKIPFYEFKNDDKEKITNQVGECCYYIQGLCREIINTMIKPAK